MSPRTEVEDYVVLWPFSIRGRSILTRATGHPNLLPQYHDENQFRPGLLGALGSLRLLLVAQRESPRLGITEMPVTISPYDSLLWGQANTPVSAALVPIYRSYSPPGQNSTPSEFSRHPSGSVKLRNYHMGQAGTKGRTDLDIIVSGQPSHQELKKIATHWQPVYNTSETNPPRQWRSLTISSPVATLPTSNPFERRRLLANVREPLRWFPGNSPRTSTLSVLDDHEEDSRRMPAPSGPWGLPVSPKVNKFGDGFGNKGTCYRTKEE